MDEFTQTVNVTQWYVEPGYWFEMSDISRLFLSELTLHTEASYLVVL